PTPEEWMTFLYDESSTETRANFEAHLHVCPDCKTRVVAWRGAMSELNAFQLPPNRQRRATPVFTSLFLKWAVAAMFVLGAGFGLGRLSKSTRIDLQQLQAELLPSLRQHLQQEFRVDLQTALGSSENQATNEFQRALRTTFAEWKIAQQAAVKAESGQLLENLAESIDSARLEDRQTTLALLQRLEQQSVAAYAGLQRKLETVAVVADRRVQQTENELGQLISYAQPDTR